MTTLQFLFRSDHFKSTWLCFTATQVWLFSYNLTAYWSDVSAILNLFTISSCLTKIKKLWFWQIQVTALLQPAKTLFTANTSPLNLKSVCHEVLKRLLDVRNMNPVYLPFQSATSLTRCFVLPALFHTAFDPALYSLIHDAPVTLKCERNPSNEFFSCH